MIRYFFHIAYKGTKYRGWQRQKNVISIQEIFEDRLEQIYKYKISCLGCGRTDAEVHASQYFFHIDVKTEITENLIHILNKNLPNDIVVYDIIKMEGEPHAQFDAIERTYEYFIHTEKNPYFSDISSYYPVENLDLRNMNIAAQSLLNYSDFRAFCKTPDRHTSTLCDIKKVFIHWNQETKQIRFTIAANKFLKSMIRIIVYNLLQVAQHKITISEFNDYLKSNTSPKYFNLAYPQGLYLSQIKYPFIDLKKNNTPFHFMDELQEKWQKL